VDPDPDPGGPKTRGSGGSGSGFGSATLPAFKDSKNKNKKIINPTKKKLINFNNTFSYTGPVQNRKEETKRPMLTMKNYRYLVSMTHVGLEQVSFPGVPKLQALISP
jgi:hypothetical protein